MIKFLEPGTHIRTDGIFFSLKNKAGISEMLTGSRNPSLFSKECPKHEMAINFLCTTIQTKTGITRIGMKAGGNPTSSVYGHRYFHDVSLWNTILEIYTGQFASFDDLRLINENKEWLLSKDLAPRIVTAHSREGMFCTSSIDIGIAEITVPLANMTYGKIFFAEGPNFETFCEGQTGERVELMQEFKRARYGQFNKFLHDAFNQNFIEPIIDIPTQIIYNKLV